MPHVDIYPDLQIVEKGAAYRTVVGAASALAALNDGLTTSYIRPTGSGSGTWSATYRLEDPGLPTGAIVERVQMLLSYSHMPKQANGAYEKFTPAGVLVGRTSGGQNSFYAYTTTEAVPSWDTKATVPTAWAGQYKMTNWDGKSYLWQHLGKPGARLYLSLNYLRNKAFNTARLYAAGVRVHYAVPPEVDLTYPTGGATVTVSRPEFTWDHQDADNRPQSAFRIKVYNESDISLPGFNPSTSKPVAEWSEATQAETSTVPSPIGPNGDYAAFIFVRQPEFAGKGFASNWDGPHLFTLDVPQPTPPLVTAVYDPTSGGIEVRAESTANLLSLHDSSAEVDEPMDEGYYTSPGMNYQRVTDFPEHGSFSFEVERVSASPTSAMWTKSRLPVVEGATYTAMLRHRAEVHAEPNRTVRARIHWFNEAGTEILISQGSAVTEVEGAWTSSTLTMAAPAGAARASVGWLYSTIGLELHYVEKVGLFRGTVLPANWSPGGFVRDETTIDLQRSLDAGTTWEDVPAALVTLEQLSLRHWDYEVPGGDTAHYRALLSTLNDEGEPIASDYSSPVSVAMPELDNWWLRTVGSVEGKGMRLSVRDFNLRWDRPQTSGYALDSDAAIVTHSGLKHPRLDLELNVLDETTYLELLDMLNQPNALLLKDVVGRQWYVTPAESVNAEMLRAVARPVDTTKIRHAHTFTLALLSVESPRA